MPFYICRMIGTGVEDMENGISDPYRPYVAEFSGVNWVMAGNAGKGCLVFVPNPTPELEANNKIHKINKKLTEKFTENEWQSLSNKLGNIGITAPQHDSNVSARQAIIWIGKQLNDAFDIDCFKVG